MNKKYWNIENFPPRLSNGEFVREFLIRFGPASVHDIYLALKEYKLLYGKKPPAYLSFWQNYIYRLKALGVLKVVGHEKVEGKWPKTIVDVVEDKLESPVWNNPQKYYILMLKSKKE